MALSDNDLLKISFVVEKTVKEQLNTKFEEAFRLLPSKEEFFSQMDTLSGEYKKIDEAQTLQSGQIADHEDKLEDHEKRIIAVEQLSP